MEVFPWFLHYLVQLWDKNWHILALSKHIFCCTIPTLKMLCFISLKRGGVGRHFPVSIDQLPSTSFFIIQGPLARKLYSYSLAKLLFWTYDFTAWEDFDISWDYCPSCDVASQAHKHEDYRDESLFL
jgi:hypothetical protein